MGYGFNFLPPEPRKSDKAQMREFLQKQLGRRRR